MVRQNGGPLSIVTSTVVRHNLWTIFIVHISITNKFGFNWLDDTVAGCFSTWELLHFGYVFKVIHVFLFFFRLLIRQNVIHVNDLLTCAMKTREHVAWFSFSRFIKLQLSSTVHIFDAIEISSTLSRNTKEARRKEMHSYSNNNIHLIFTSNSVREQSRRKYLFPRLIQIS